MDAILNFFSNNFHGSAWIAALLLAMIPIAEAKVAIPFAMSHEIWGNAALSPVGAGLVGFIGSLLPAFFLLLFLKPLFEMLKKTKMFKKMVIYFENMFVKKIVKSNMYKEQVQVSDYTNQKTFIVNDISKDEKVSKLKKLQKMLTLAFFVAIPLPLAGVWTSSAIAALADMKFGPSILSIALGNLLECLYVTILCALFIDSILIVLIVAVILIAIYVIIMGIINIRKNKLKSKI